MSRASSPDGLPPWTVTPARYEDLNVRQLLMDLNAEQLATYGFADDPAATPGGDFVRPSRLFLLVQDDDGTPSGCGGWRLLDETTAEIKRMYIRPEARGRGMGRAILQRLEVDARAYGVTRIQLETGVANRTALARYRSEG